MKLLIDLCFVTLVGLSVAEFETDSTNCFYYRGICYRQCEEGTYSYNTACSFITPEATCDNPDPEPETSAEICVYSDCYCDPPTVRDTATNKCVRLEECPEKEEQKEMEGV